MTFPFTVSKRRIATALLASCLCLTGPPATYAQPADQGALDLPKLTRSLPARLTRQQDLDVRYEDLKESLEGRRLAFRAVSFDDGNEATFRKRFDLLWSINDAVTRRQKIDLTAIGFDKEGEGRFALRKSEASKWKPLYVTLAIWRDPKVFDRDAKQLKARGMEDENLTALRNYLAAQKDPTAIAEQRSLFDQMARAVRDRRSRGQDVSADELAAFKYQMTLSSEDSQRRWAVEMFSVLDRRGQRILASVVDELNEGSDYSLYVLAPTDIDKRYKEELEYLASGRYAEQMDRQLQKELSR